MVIPGKIRKTLEESFRSFLPTRSGGDHMTTQFHKLIQNSEIAKTQNLRWSLTVWEDWLVVGWVVVGGSLLAGFRGCLGVEVVFTPVWLPIPTKLTDYHHDNCIWSRIRNSLPQGIDDWFYTKIQNPKKNIKGHWMTNKAFCTVLLKF